MALFYGGQGVSTNLKTPSNVITLNGGECFNVAPAGWYEVKPGKYTVIQQRDPITGIWRTIGAGSTGASLERLYSDGQNYRLANQTGCAVGALVTNGGTGYTSAPTVAATAGSSVWQAIVGGAVSATVTISNGGSNYAYPPIVLISAPPSPGIQATAHCTLTSGAVSSVTIDDQGAGYNTPPIITFVNDPREGLNGVTVGTNAAAVTALTGAQTVTGILCLDHGNPATYSATAALPTFTFSGGGGTGVAATIIMCLSITAYAVSTTTTGSGYVAPVIVSAYGGFPATAAAYTNPFTNAGLVKGRNAFIVASILTGAFTATGQVVNDGGIYPGFPTMYVASANVPVAGAVAEVFLNPTMGQQVDTSVVGSA